MQSDRQETAAPRKKRKRLTYHRIEPSEGETPMRKCTGCRTCEVYCSFSHGGECNPELAGIRIQEHDSGWVSDTEPQIYRCSVCNQCGVCMSVCPAEAMRRSEKTGAVVIDDSKCTRCKLCVRACPFDAIWFDAYSNRIVKCDLCEGVPGGPQCVAQCPSKVLRVVTVESVHA